MFFVKKLNEWKLINVDDMNTFIKTRKDWWYSVEIIHHKSCTPAQRKLYFKILDIASKKLQCTVEELHYEMKHQIIWDVDWEPSTKTLTLNEFSWYIEEVLNLLAAQWVVLWEDF